MIQERNLRYIVVTLSGERENPDGTVWPVETGVVLCANEKEIFAAVERAWEAEDDWSLFEVVDGKVERRAVRFTYRAITTELGANDRERDGLVIVR